MGNILFKGCGRLLGLVLPGLLAVFLSGAATADEAKKASGRFEDNKGHWFDIGGAYAFPARVGLDEEPGIFVAISNASFRADNIDRLWDRKSFIDKFFSDEETAVAYLQFTRDGKFMGVSYYFGSGAGCGICYSSKTKSTVKKDGERLAGTITYKEEGESYSFDVTFDVPVAPALPGKLMPSGGGDAGKSYMAFHRALLKRDTAEVRKLVVSETRERIDKAAKEKKEGPNQYVEWYASEHPEEVKIIKTFEKGDTTTLVVTNGSKDMMLHGDVLMKKEGGRWLFYLENFYFGDWPEGLKP